MQLVRTWWLGAAAGLALAVDASTCSQAQITAALTPYMNQATAALTLCAMDMSSTLDDFLDPYFLILTSSAKAAAYASSANCAAEFAIEKKAFRSISPPCTLQPPLAPMTSTQYASLSFSDLVKLIQKARQGDSPSDPDVTSPPATKAPVTKAPVTKAPVTSSPEAPATDGKLQQCDTATMKAVLAPYMLDIAVAIGGCAADVGVKPETISDPKVQLELTDAQVDAYAKSANCAKEYKLEQTALATMATPCILPSPVLSLSTADIVRTPFETYVQLWRTARAKTSPNLKGGTTAPPTAAAHQAQPRLVVAIVAVCFGAAFVV